LNHTGIQENISTTLRALYVLYGLKKPSAKTWSCSWLLLLLVLWLLAGIFFGKIVRIEISIAVLWRWEKIWRCLWISTITRWVYGQV